MAAVSFDPYLEVSDACDIHCDDDDEIESHTSGSITPVWDSDNETFITAAEFYAVIRSEVSSRYQDVKSQDVKSEDSESGDVKSQDCADGDGGIVKAKALEVEAPTIPPWRWSLLLTPWRKGGLDEIDKVNANAESKTEDGCEGQSLKSTVAEDVNVNDEPERHDVGKISTTAGTAVDGNAKLLDVKTERKGDVEEKLKTEVEGEKFVTKRQVAKRVDNVVKWPIIAAQRMRLIWPAVDAAAKQLPNVVNEEEEEGVLKDTMQTTSISREKGACAMDLIPNGKRLKLMPKIVQRLRELEEVNGATDDWRSTFHDARAGPREPSFPPSSFRVQVSYNHLLFESRLEQQRLDFGERINGLVSNSRMGGA